MQTLRKKIMSLINFKWEEATVDIDNEGKTIYVVYAEDSNTNKSVRVVIEQSVVDKLDQEGKID